MKLVEFLVSKISYYHSNKSYVVVLNEVNGDRRLPIMLGSYEAQAIAIAMESIDTQRPLTHDLLINTLQGLGLSLKNVTIKRREEEIFFSTINIVSPSLVEKNIDSRPSDAIILALKLHCPIFVNELLLDNINKNQLAILDDDQNIIQSTKIESLENQLQKAIDREDYEIAAKLRDKIKFFND
tara:strand:- start:738 stop:1286 length:549 start_codon:yes stop_codon:yes gene_type:complete